MIHRTLDIGHTLIKWLDKLRWRYACWVDKRNPGACWAHLASWAMRYTEWESIDWDCEDGQEHGLCSCWCGKKCWEPDAEPREAEVKA